MLLLNSYRFAAPVLWTPYNIPAGERLILDPLDPALFQLSGSSITQYTSPEGFAFNGTNVTYNATGLNGQPTVDFSAGHLTSTAAASAWNMFHNGTLITYISLVKPGNIADPNTQYGLIGTASATTNVGSAIFYDDRAPTRNNRFRASTFLGVSGQTAISSDATTGQIMLPNTYQILTAQMAPAAATAAARLSFSVNAGTAVSNNTSTTAPTTANATNTLQIGAIGANVVPLTGGKGPMIFLYGANAHSTDYRDRIQGWLAHVYYRLQGQAVPLPVSHPYYSVPPYV
jgi:hypothetical protein